MLDEDTYASSILFAVEEGSFQYEIGRHRGEAKFGDLVLCPPGIPFRRKTLQPLSFHYVSFHWEIGTYQNSDGVTFPEGKITFADTKRLSSTYNYLRQCNATVHMMSHYIKDIWQQHALETKLLEVTEQQSAGCPRMNRAIRHIRENAYDHINLGDLAKALEMTPVQLTRRFRAAFGKTPSDYVTELRLRKACKLLEETTLSLDQIAGQCGYENGFYLSRIFTRKKSVCPSEYRKAHQI